MEKVTIVKRLASMLIDYLVIGSIAVLSGIPILIIAFLIKRYFNIDLYWTGVVIIVGIYINKDFFRGKSFAKRLIGLQVMKNKKDEVATRFQCFIRNLTIILFPLEVFISLFSRQRRIGDLLAGTRIENSEKEEVSTIIGEIKSELKKKKNA
ncbi:MAG: RDD family protein [Bacteroidia bacterium]|nr:RDD family protein [Bacteroidia bacterium]